MVHIIGSKQQKSTVSGVPPAQYRSGHISAGIGNAGSIGNPTGLAVGDILMAVVGYQAEKLNFGIYNTNTLEYMANLGNSTWTGSYGYVSAVYWILIESGHISGGGGFKLQLSGSEVFQVSVQAWKGNGAANVVVLNSNFVQPAGQNKLIIPGGAPGVNSYGVASIMLDRDQLWANAREPYHFNMRHHGPADVMQVSVADMMQNYDGSQVVWENTDDGVNHFAEVGWLLDLR